MKPRRRKDGSTAWYWVCPKAPRAAGYEPGVVRLVGETAEMEARAQVLNAECLEWASGRRRRDNQHDGTIRSLIRLYETDPGSPYSMVSQATQKSYAADLSQLDRTIGARRVDAITAADVRGWHRNWLGPDPDRPMVRKAHGLVTMLRIIMKYGVELQDPGAIRLSTMLGAMRFSTPTPRVAFITREQVAAVRRELRRRGYPSAALAVAIQYECVLRQKDVIGEWLPCQAADIGGAIVDGGQKWSTGLLWGTHIDPRTLVLAKPTSKSRGRMVAEHDLTMCPMVIEELADYPADRRIGPVIINETTGKPWKRFNFRRMWSAAASAAGIPRGVWNMDLRAGGITEGLAAGADLATLSKVATHTHEKTTFRYVRDTISQSRKVAMLRAKKREGGE